MKGEFTAIIEPAPEGGFWAICPEIPGANGQGENIEETKNNLREAIILILEDHREDIIRGLPDDAIQEKVLIGWNGGIFNVNWEKLVAIWKEKGLLIPYGSIQKMVLWKRFLAIMKLKNREGTKGTKG